MTLILPLPKRSAVSIASTNRVRFSSVIGDAILNDLHTRAESFDFWIRVVHAHDFVVDPNAQVALLLEEIEKFPRLRSRGDCDPERDENRSSRYPERSVAERVILESPRRFE